MTTQNKKPAPRKAPAKKPAAAKPAPTPEKKEPEIPAAKPVPPSDDKPDQGGQDLSGLDAMLNNASDDQGDDESLGTDIQAQKAKAEQEAAELAAARLGAAMAVGFTSQLLEAKYPYVQLDDKKKENLIDKAAPVLKKYHYEPPPWMKKYQEEIDLGVAIGTAGFSVYVQVQNHKREEQKRLIEERRRRAAEARGERQPATRVDLSVDDQGATEGDARRVDAA